MTTHSSAKIQLIAQIKGKSRSAKTFELAKGMGDAGQAVRIQAETGTVYELRDVATRKGPQGIRARRSGRNLEIFLEGSVQPDAVIEGYYDEALIEFPKDSLTGVTSQGDLGIYVMDDGLRPALTTLAGETTPIVLLDNTLLFNGWQWGLAAGAGVGVLQALSGSGDASEAATPAPAAPTAKLEASSDNGLSNSDRVTSITTPTLSGKGLAGHTITIKNAAGQVVATAQVDANGDWSVATTALPQGVQTLSVTQTSPSGKTSQPATIELTIDTTAPASGSGALASSSDSGTLGDNTTNDNTPALSGTAEANATVQVTVNGQTYTVTANAQGTWSLPATATLPDGTYTPVITVTDAAGNSSTANGTPFTVDASAPATPGVQIPEATRGVSTAEAADGVALVITLPNDAVVGDTLTTVVTKPDGGTLTLTRVLTAADISAGQYSQTIAQVELLNSATQYRDGNWTTSTTLTDTAGNTSPAQTDGFELSANAPTLTLATTAGDGIVNALEKTGDLPVSGSTSAEVGQPVTVQLMSGSTVLGTYYTVVKADGSFALNIPQADLPADGIYTLTADVSNFAGTPAAQATQPVTFDTTAPTISVTYVAGDAVSATGSGTFDGTERGFNLADYTLSSTVTTPPVISGTTSAEAGQVVSVLFNQVSYTATVQAGTTGNPNTWSVTLSQDEAKALVHGSTYAITASVKDLAGNPSTPDTDNHLVVNIAPPDVPTVVPQYAGTTTPVITGTAQKLSGGSAIALAAGDTIAITLNGVTVTATIQASGTATNITGVTYDPTTKVWTLTTATAGSFGLADDRTYNVQVSTTTAGGTLTRSDISAGELVIDTTPPTITLNPISPDAAGASVINGAEQNLPVTLTGTTTAQVGSTVTLTGLNGQTYTATVQAGTNGGANTFSIPVSGTVIAALTDGTYTPQVSVTNLFGLTGTDTETLRVDTTAPSAPTVALPEAPGGISALEAANGTPLVVTLPADAKVGDTVTTVVLDPNGGSTVLTHVIQASELPAAQGGTATGTGPFTISQTIPSTALTVDGPWTTSTTLTDTAGNTSVPQPGAFVLDTTAPGVPGVALPEAANGVNAAEALSNGGTPLNVTLPGDAGVGDTVTTVVTLPTGGTLTLTNVLTAADIAAGSISQLIPSSALTQDGTWTTSTTVTDLAGNASAPRTGSFVLDTTPPPAPAAALAPASDSGTVGDSITADNTPSISGTGTAGDTITVTFPGGEVKTAVVAADGTWSVTPITPLADGVNTISVTATDPAGNVSAPTALPITIDTTVPAAPTAALATVSDTGTLGDRLTKDNTPTLSGTGAPGDTITIKDAAGNVIATALVDANGNWSATTTTLPDGLNTLSVTATDPAGNTGPAVALPITIDTSAPAAPAAVLDPASDSSTKLDGITSDATPTLSGTGTNGDTITVTFPGGEVKTVTVVNGVWSVTPTNPLLDGLNNIRVTATDPAGNTSPATTVPVTIDTTPPAAPLADVAAASDTGKSNTDNITSDTTPTISGAGVPGDTITVTFPGGEVKIAVVTADGTWSVTPTTALGTGLNNITVTATDPAGNTSAATTVSVTIDTTAPSAPTVDALRTNDSTPVITGTATLGAGETLTVTVNGATYNVTVGAGGVWSLNTSATTPVSGILGAFTSGVSYPVTATVTDTAGNATSDATTSELLYDTTAPSVPTVNPLATNDSTPVITGTANLRANETLTVTVNGATYNVTVATNGTWRLDTGATTPTSGTLGAFVNGTSYPVTATITYGAVVSNDTSTNELLFDTTAPSAPAGDVAAASDTGISATDNITSDTTPTIVGTGTAGDTITLYAPNGTTVLGTAVVDAAGNWAITSTALPQGTSALQITATDPAGNTSAPGIVSVTIDTTAPAAPAAVLDPSSDTGTQGDSTTKDNTPTLSGTGEVGATVTIKDAAGNVIATAVVDANGAWSATPTTALPNGLNALSVTATDLAGNVSQSTALPITIDTTTPNAPAAALASSSDTGIVGDGKTADTTPTLTGNGTPGDSITVKDASGNVIATATVAPNGSWSAKPTTPLADGVYNLQVTATDPAGNTSAPTTVPVTIDATASNAPTPDVAATSDTGSSSTDNLTSDTTPTIVGTGIAGDTITLYAPNGTTVLGTAVVDGNGKWAITPTTALPDGVTTLTATATDLQGNTSLPGSVSVTIDTTAPAAPAAALDSSSDTGNLGDSKTKDTTPKLSGTGTPGDTITIKNAAGNTVGTAVVDANGNWSTDTTTLPEGLNNLSVTATDKAGNTSLPTALPITIDTTVAAPVVAPTNGLGAVSGTGEPGATVTLKNGATVLGTAVVDASGNWSVPLAAAVPNGTSLSATQTDLAGNLSPADTEAVDTSVPVINPTNGVVLTGTGKPNDTISLTLADGTVLRDANGAPLTAVVGSNGTWTATPGAPVPDGATVVATDTANNKTDSTTVDALPPPAPVASLALASDSGRVGDGLTNNTTPTLSGAGASPGDTIKLYAPDGTTLLGTAVVAADGTWSIPVPTALSNGTHNFQLTATDPVGNTSAPTTLPVTIDTSAPAVPTVTLATSSDSGTLGDGITSDNTPTLTGTGTPGDTITIRDAAGTVIATATVAPNGSWTATPTAALPEGLNTLSVTATDPAGNTGPAAALPLIIDTTAPAAPTAVLASSSDSGTLGDGITNDTTPTLSGTGTPGDTITIKDAAGNVIATAVVGAGGTWTATPTTALPEGLNTLSITATDPAGNTGPATALPITIDTTGPAAPAAVLATVSDSGKLGDSTTSDTTPTIQGTGFAGDTIIIKNAAGTVIATATVGTDGTWTATPTTALPEGLNQLSVTATDPAGNTSAATALPITIDTTAPAAPAAALALVSESGTVGDSTTTDNTPTVQGTGTPGDTITLKDAAGNVIATAVVAANGSWSVTTPTLPDGVNNLSVTATDPAGNTSAPTALPITVDTSIGPVSIAASNGVGTITGTGEPGATLTLKDSATGAVIGTVTVAPDGSWSVPLTTPLPDGTILSATQVDAAGNTSSPESETINTAIPVLAPSNGTVITGTGKPGNTISVTGTNGAVIGTALVDANGNWSLTPTSALPDGTVVTATDTSSGLTDTTVVDATPPALPVGDVAASSDTGTSNTDNITSDTTPTITGSGATPGDTINLYAPDGTTLLGAAVVDASGNWAITPTTALGVGAQALKLTASDPLGNTTTPATLNVTIDITAPAVPTATLSSASDSGTLGDSITNDTTPTLSGTGEPGATINIKDAAGNVIATAVVDGSGNWSATTTTLPHGVNALSITATDAAGNTSASTALSLTIDTTAPATPAAPDMTAATDLGASATDNLTKDSTPDLTVTAPPTGGSLVLYVDGVAVAATYNATTSTITPNVTLTDGAHSLTYAVVDAAGNASAQSAALSVNIDTTAPAQPAAPDMTAATDSGSSSTDNNTKDSTPTFTVTAPPAGGSLVLYVDGNPVAATYDATGTLTPNVALTDGPHTITYTAVDAAGNVSTASTALSVTIDTIAPSAPSGILGAGTTNDTTPTLSGTGEPNATITVKDGAGNVIATATAGTNGTWTATPTNPLPGGSQTLQVSASDSAGNASPATAVSLTIVAPPTITSITEASSNLNMTEANSDGGTPVVIGLTGTGAVDGQVITVNWGGQTFTQVLTAADIAANTVTVVVPTATIQAETPVNTSETIAVTVSLGGTVTSTATNVTVNFIQPGAPTISSTLWSTTATTSSTSGIPEARDSWSYATFPTSPSGIPDNKLYYSEAISTADSGTLVRVQLPLGTGAVNPPAQGDTLTLNWGNQVINVGALTAAHITAKYVDVVVPFATIDSQPFGDVTVTATLTSATSGSTSAPATVIVDWSFDLPLNNMAAMSSGFAINGLAANSMTGYPNNAQGVIDLGDVNGDGYDDFSIVDLYSNHYIVYGKAGLTTVEMSSLAAAGNTNGFTFNSVAYYNGPAGDLNGDGLNDVVMQNTSTTAYVLLGNTRSPGTLTPSNFAASSAGYTITSPVDNFAGISVMGDVNGDGFDDLLLNFYVVGGAVAYSSFLLYGSANKTNITLPTGSTGTYSNGFFINTNNAFLTNAPTLVSATGDFNGDGYADILLSNHVYFGGPNLTGVSSSALNAAGSGRGFAIQGITTADSSHVYATTGGDINGDGLDDILINDGVNVAYAIFGKTSDAPVNVTSLASTGAGFVLNPGTRPGPLNNDITDVDLIGDFNGDGLADILVSEFNVPLNSTGAIGLAYLVYGRTGSTPISLTDLAASEGFRINGISPNAYSGYSVSAAGDVNGDGFADLLVVSMQDDPDGTRVNAGITRVVYGGVTRINDMVFQPLNGDAIGTTGADTLTGTSGANQLVAGDGNDTLIGAGGADVLYGGRGNDLIEIDASNITALGTNVGNTSQAVARVDGGTGTDTLQLMASLDLTQVRPAAIQSIERFNLFSSGTLLKMGLMDVIALSEKNNPFNTATGWTASASGGAVGWGTVNVGAQVVVDGTSANDLYLEDSWVNVGTVENSGKIYRVLESRRGEAQVLVEASVNLYLPPVVAPTAPIISHLAWSSTNTVSALQGIPEAYYDKNGASFSNDFGGVAFNDLTLYLSEASATANPGTVLRIQLPTTGAVPPQVGDTLQIVWGTQTYNVPAALTAADITTNKYVDVVVPLSVIESQPFGTLSVAATITSASSGGVSGTAPLNVKWAYDLPTTELTSQSNGFAINGRFSDEKLGSNGYEQGSVNLGDVNGDGYDDFALTTQGGTVRYIVYGRSGLATVELSNLETVGNTQGFIITGVPSSFNTTAGDVNGDGLSDIVMGGQDTSYVVLGQATSPGQTSLTALVPATASASGYRISVGSTVDYSTHYLESRSVIRDVNGDGFDDILLNFSSQNSFLLYGSASGANTAIPDATTGTFANGFWIDGGGFTSGGKDTPESGDFNGDGYGDFLQVTYDTSTGAFNKAYVVYGGSGLSGLSLASLDAGTSSRGFMISGLSDMGSLPSVSFLGSATGDINGDGLDDIIFNDGTNSAYVIFGKNDNAPVNLSAISAGNGGFVINGATTLANNLDVDVIGDFNGDGLADMILGDPNMRINNVVTGGAYVVYGRTGTQAVTMTNLSYTEGFRIDGGTVSVQMGKSVSAAGDVNGDGFADLIVNARFDSPDGTRISAGVTRVIYGGVDKLDGMTLQSANGDAIGTTGPNTLTGNSGANQLVAGDGNDTLIGAGGADVLYGGRGNDVIQINASNITALGNNINASEDIARIDGGNGVDTIKLDGSGLMLDLTAIRGAAISNIEKVDLTGSGDNTLKLTLADVLQSATSSNVFNSGNTTSGLTATVAKNQLMVDGNAGDKVVLSDLANWTTAGTNAVANGHTYVVYNHNTSASQLLIDQLITTSAT